MQDLRDAALGKVEGPTDLPQRERLDSGQKLRLAPAHLPRRSRARRGDDEGSGVRGHAYVGAARVVGEKAKRRAPGPGDLGAGDSCGLAVKTNTGRVRPLKSLPVNVGAGRQGKPRPRATP